MDTGTVDGRKRYFEKARMKDEKGAEKNAEKRRVEMKLVPSNVNGFSSRAIFAKIFFAQDKLFVLFVCETF